MIVSSGQGLAGQKFTSNGTGDWLKMIEANGYSIPPMIECSLQTVRPILKIWEVNKTIWVWVNTYRYIISGMNIHLPAILM